MATLYKRATPSQAAILRIVEGACHNAAHAHPDALMSERFARSIAKRAAGTLTAGWPDVLAAKSLRRSESDDARDYGSRRRQQSHHCKVAERGALKRFSQRSPLIPLWIRISKMVGDAKRARNEQLAQTLINILRLISASQKPPQKNI